jgi:2'-5' RNA ligase
LLSLPGEKKTRKFSKFSGYNMGKIAVDVVLLPSDEMMDKAIQANARLVEKFGSEIVLNKENCLPHVSLAMGCIDEQDISSIEKVLELIAKKSPLRNLTILGIRTSINARGETVSVFEVEKTKEIQSLHEKVIKKVRPYFSYDVTSNMIYDKEAADTALLWIKNYPEKASYANFLPHITIGYGQIQDGPFPVEFIASRLALCHLGNHCTCGKLLASIPLDLVRDYT